MSGVESPDPLVGDRIAREVLQTDYVVLTALFTKGPKQLITFNFVLNSEEFGLKVLATNSQGVFRVVVAYGGYEGLRSVDGSGEFGV